MIEIRYPFKEVATPSQDITIGLKESTPMDEFLHERLEELKKIDYELERLERILEDPVDVSLLNAFRQLNLSVMIERAEEAYRKF